MASLYVYLGFTVCYLPNICVLTLGNCELSIRSRYCNAKNRTSLAFQYQRIRRHNIECSQEIANLIKNAILTLFIQDFMTEINTAMH